MIGIPVIDLLLHPFSKATRMRYDCSCSAHPSAGVLLRQRAHRGVGIHKSITEMVRQVLDKVGGYTAPACKRSAKSRQCIWHHSPQSLLTGFSREACLPEQQPLTCSRLVSRTAHCLHVMDGVKEEHNAHEYLCQLCEVCAADLVSVTASSVWCKTAKPSVSTVTIFDNSIDGGALWKAKLRASAACIHIRRRNASVCDTFALCAGA